MKTLVIYVKPYVMWSGFLKVNLGKNTLSKTDGNIQSL